MMVNEAMMSAPITRAELDAWKAQVGRRCPTPQGAMAFGMTQMKLGRVLKPDELERFNTLVIADRDPEELDRVREDRLREGRADGDVDRDTLISMTKAEIAKLEAKAMGCSEARKEKIKCKKTRHSFRGRHLRVDATGAIGRGTWTFGGNFGETAVRVRLDSGEEVRASIDEVTTLCERCDTPASSRCVACKMVHYCGAACQKVHWKAGHKQECRQLRESQSEGNA